MRLVLLASMSLAVCLFPACGLVEAEPNGSAATAAKGAPTTPEAVLDDAGQVPGNSGGGAFSGPMSSAGSPSHSGVCPTPPLVGGPPPAWATGVCLDGSGGGCAAGTVCVTGEDLWLGTAPTATGCLPLPDACGGAASCGCVDPGLCGSGTCSERDRALVCSYGTPLCRVGVACETPGATCTQLQDGPCSSNVLLVCGLVEGRLALRVESYPCSTPGPACTWSIGGSGPDGATSTCSGSCTCGEDCAMTCFTDCPDGSVPR